MLTLFDVQKTHVNKLTNSVKDNNCALDSSETGCGKTLCAIETAKALGLTPIVVCPKAVTSAWKDALAFQECPNGGVYTWEKLRTGNVPDVLKRKGKKSFLWTLPKNKFVIIFDEAHKAKSVRTLNSNMLSTAATQEYKTLILSATIAEDPREMRATGFALGLHNLKNFWAWAQAWGCNFDTFGALQFPEKESHRLVELHKLIYPSRGSRLTRKDLGKHFQECKIVTTPLSFSNTSKIRKLVTELSGELEIIEERREGDGDEAIALTKILRLRQEIEMLKVPDIVTEIETHRKEGNSVAVFLNFTDSIQAVSIRLTESHRFIVGGQTQIVRDQAMSDFQSNKSRVILCNTAAGGVGVSLHDIHGGHPRVALISPTYNAKEFKQVLGRVDRVGNKTPSLQHILVAAGTLEVDILKTMMLKIKNLELLHNEKDVDNTCMSKPTKPTKPAEIEAEPDHAEFGPSGMKLIKTCPGHKGSVGTNPAAEMGTRIHLALETGDWSTLSDWESSLAQYTQNAEALIFDLHGFKDFEDHKEIRLTIKLLTEETFGTCDRFSISGREAVQIDYKTGKHGVEEPLFNEQAKSYVLGAFQRFPQIEVIHFYLICCQRDEILSGTFTRDMVPDLTLELSAIVAEARKYRFNFKKAKVKDLNPTPLTCEYCANAGKCPALADMLTKVAKKYKGSGEKLIVPKIVDGEKVQDPAVIGQLLTLAPVLEEAVKGWKTRAKEMIFDSGYEVPGYEVRTRAGRRSITCPKAAWGRVKDIVELEDFFDGIKSYPVGIFEKLIANVAPSGKKKTLIAEIISELESEDVISHGDDVNYITKIKN